MDNCMEYGRTWCSTTYMSEFCLAQMDLIRKEVELKRIEHMNAKRHRINIRLARRSLAIGKSGHKMNWWILIFSGIALVLAAVSLVLQYLASKQPPMPPFSIRFGPFSTSRSASLISILPVSPRPIFSSSARIHGRLARRTVARAKPAWPSSPSSPHANRK